MLNAMSDRYQAKSLPGSGYAALMPMVTTIACATMKDL
jgi:hypothetical protein